MEQMMCRNDMTLISGNMKALECKATLDKLRVSHPHALRMMLTTLRNVRNLTDMFNLLAAPDGQRSGLAYDLSVDEKEVKNFVEQTTRDHMLQFTNFKLPASFCSAGRVRGWIAKQQAAGENEGQSGWTYTWDELQRCRAEFASKDGAEVSLRDLYTQFCELDYRLCGYTDEETTKMQAKLNSD